MAEILKLPMPLIQVSSKDGRTHTIHVKESVEQVDEGITKHQIHKSTDHGKTWKFDTEHSTKSKAEELIKQRMKAVSIGKKYKIVRSTGKKLAGPQGKLPESVEQVDELSQGLKKRYINRAAMSAASNAHSDGVSKTAGSKGKHKNKVLNRLRGINRATGEDVEQVDELSNKLLKRYDRKSATSGANLRKTMDKVTNTVRKSSSGYATQKQAARFTKAMDKHSNRMDGANRSQQIQLKRAQKESVEHLDEKVRPLEMTQAKYDSYR